MVLLSDKHPIDLTIGQELPPTFHYAWVILFVDARRVFRSRLKLTFNVHSHTLNVYIGLLIERIVSCPCSSPASETPATRCHSWPTAIPFCRSGSSGSETALCKEFEATDVVWSVRAEGDLSYPNIGKLAILAEGLASQLRERLLARIKASAAELALYQDVVIYLLYHRHEPRLYDAIKQAPGRPVSTYREFRRDFEHFLQLPGLSHTIDADHLFACLFQIRRAFYQIFNHIVGGSMPTARLRAAVWQSIFTHDMQRYQRSLHRRMHDVTTLVTGPSGTGKELVARAIGLSQYVVFDPKREAFTTNIDESFHALNLSALPATLIESELFGHRKGAFTGALDDRTGWFEACPPQGTVLLDEIGELNAAIQVKLLRVLQTREFQRIGETKSREFQGKVIASTNRDLPHEMRAGRFREDLYYRLCSDLIVTPSLQEQLADSPGELRNLVRFVGERIAGHEEAESLAAEVLAWIEQELGADYPWPGNVRELEQCVRNVLVRKQYRPQSRPKKDPREELADGVSQGRLTAKELLRQYCTLVYSQTANYQETARRLGMDRRTVKSHVDPGLLGR